MSESQNTEWKRSWRDEYIKWICGFANASGGRLEIGKDDDGKIIGITDARKLMEDIPNKVRDLLGILIDVNLHEQDGKEWLSLVVDAHPNPVSYKGQYHYRSGSTKQELKGTALNKFLLKKHGRKWDGVPVPHVAVTDLSPAAFDYFRKQAVQTKRLDERLLKRNESTLLKKLRLIEDSYLKRAALLLFHPDPEKFFTGAFVKIGYFRTDDDLRFQDEVHGNLFEQVVKTMDLLLSKYLEAQIRYQGLSRIEEYAWPEPALREALLNAVAHKDYSSGVPIQIKVYDDKIIFWNAGQLPESWTVDNLFKEHPSIPYNPDVATTFFRAGLVEAWGRGTIKIIKECKKAGLPKPAFSYDAAGFRIEFQKMPEKMPEKTPEKILYLIKGNPDITIAELSDQLGVNKRTIERNLKKLQDANLLKRIGGAKGGHWKIIEQK